MWAFMRDELLGLSTSVSHCDMNISNDGMAHDNTGLDSLDISCCTLCGI